MFGKRSGGSNDLRGDVAVAARPMATPAVQSPSLAPSSDTSRSRRAMNSSMAAR